MGKKKETAKKPAPEKEISAKDKICPSCAEPRYLSQGKPYCRACGI